MTDTDTPPALSKPQQAVTLGLLGAAIFHFLPELLLIGSEMWITIWAAAWAVDGLFKLSGPLAYVPWVVFGLPGLWASYHLIRLAIVRWQDREQQIV